MAAPDPGSGRDYRLVVSLVSSPGDLGAVTGSGPADRPVSVLPPRPDDRRDPWLRTLPSGGSTLPPAGQPGHGRAAYVRRQPVRIVDGRFHGGYADVFEVICVSCGDHPYLDYSEVRRGFSRSAGRARCRRPWPRTTSTSGCPRRRAQGRNHPVLATRQPGI
jgi:hypothetical protein